MTKYCSLDFPGVVRVHIGGDFGAKEVYKEKGT